MAYNYNIDTPNLFGNFVAGQEVTERRNQRALENQQVEQDRAQKEQDRTRQTVANFARQWSASPPQAKPMLIRVAKQAISQNPGLAEALGGQMPESDDPAEWDGFMGGGALFDGGGNGANVQSTYIDDQGNRVAVMRDGSRMVLGKNAPNNQIIEGAGGFYGVNKGDLSAAPVRMGGQPQAAPPTQYEASIDIDSLPPGEREAAMMAMRGQDAHVVNGQAIPGNTITAQQDFGARGPQQAKPAGPILQAPAKAPPAKSALQDRLDIAAARGATKEELDAIATGRDKPAGIKPMPTTALKMAQASREKAQTAKTINTSLGRHLARIESGELSFGLASNLTNRARNVAGKSTPQSRNFGEFEADLQKLRNDSLRLNTGVQTDGDAQRAWAELMANINDTEFVKQRLTTIDELNKQAALLHEANAEETYANYGRGPDGKPVGGGVEAAPPPKGAPKVGEERDGYRYRGGNPAKKESWEKI